MKNTKKALLALTCAVMLVVGSVMGTMAYLTDRTQTVTNTFTIGNVDIKLDEAKIVNGVATTERTETGNAYHLLPGQVYAKDPTVTVVANSEDSYVRAFVTVKYAEAADAVLAKYNYQRWFDFNQNWTIQPNVETTKANGMITRTYEFRYNTSVTKAATDTKLEPLFTKITVPGGLTNEEIATLNNLNINVIAQAIQATGFANADAAWGEWK